MWHLGVGIQSAQSTLPGMALRCPLPPAQDSHCSALRWAQRVAKPLGAPSVHRVPTQHCQLTSHWLVTRGEL